LFLLRIIYKVQIILIWSRIMGYR